MKLSEIFQSENKAIHGFKGWKAQRLNVDTFVNELRDSSNHLRNINHDASIRLLKLLVKVTEYAEARLPKEELV